MKKRNKILFNKNLNENVCLKEYDDLNYKYFSYRDTVKCQEQFTQMVIRKMDIEYIPLEVLKLIIRDINHDVKK